MAPELLAEVRQVLLRLVEVPGLNRRRGDVELGAEALDLPLPPRQDPCVRVGDVHEEHQWGGGERGVLVQRGSTIRFAQGMFGR